MEELPPSKLGTKSHWDDVYEREVKVFNDIGDEGEVWFGSSSVRKMRQWAHRNLPPSTSSSTPLRILECGAGNGTLLLSFLTSPSGQPQYFDLTGVDYSPKAAILAKGIEEARRKALQGDEEDNSSDDSDGSISEDDNEEISSTVQESSSAINDGLASQGRANGANGHASSSVGNGYKINGHDLPNSNDASRPIENGDSGLGKTRGKTLNHVSPVNWMTVDLLAGEMEGEWDLVLDKGTFDALCLSDKKTEDGRLPSLVYPERVSKLVKDGGMFCITSCNFTEDEVKQRWTAAGLGFEFHSSVPHRSFSFGGKKGNTICTVAFRKIPSTSAAQPSPNSQPNLNGSSSQSGNTDPLARSRSPRTATDSRAPILSALNDLANGHSVMTRTRADGEDQVLAGSEVDPVVVCIDAGGTKTDVAIASSCGVIARAAGGTGNMAEVGAPLCAEIITTAVLEAVQKLPSQYHQTQLTPLQKEGKVCPVKFSDIWVGISGCDTPLDQERMSELLSPFFDIPDVPVLNDAHLLGGPLLTHHCPWGIAVIAGTGSVVVSLEVTEKGLVEQTGRRGGMGYMLGDDGSSFDLGRCAIRAAIDTFDAEEEAEGGLAETMRKHFDVKVTGEILGKVHELDATLSPLDAANMRKLQMSSLAKPVIEAFNQSPPDPIAVQAVQDATRPLIASIVSLAKQNENNMSRLTGRRRNVSEAGLTMGGGLIRQASYRQVILDGLAEEGIVFGTEAVVEDVAGEGALGLVERARGNARMNDLTEDLKEHVNTMRPSKEQILNTKLEDV